MLELLVKRNRERQYFKTRRRGWGSINGLDYYRSFWFTGLEAQNYLSTALTYGILPYEQYKKNELKLLLN